MLVLWNDEQAQSELFNDKKRIGSVRFDQSAVGISRLDSTHLQNLSFMRH
jgi:hypothetical protein